MEKITVSHSEAEAHVTCERRHYYLYGLRLQGKADNMSDALYRGIVGHEALKSYHLEPDPLKQLRAGMLAIQENMNIDGYVHVGIVGELTTLLKAYHEYWSEKGEEWIVLEAESSRMYEISDDLNTQIRPDLIVRIPGRGLYVVDHKWLYNFMSQTSLELLPQLPKYLLGLRQHGIEIRGMIYNEIRYRDNAKEKFKRQELPVNKVRLQQTMKEHILIANRIRAKKLLSIEEWEDGIVRTANKGVCDMCPFKMICAAENEGQDTTLMREVYYEPRKNRNEVVIDA